MNRILKLLIASTFISCFIYSGIVWTIQISKKQIDHANTSQASTTEVSHAQQLAGAPNLDFYGLQSFAKSHGQDRMRTEPVLIFLFGTGLVGFFALARRRIKADKREVLISQQKLEDAKDNTPRMKPYLRIPSSPDDTATVVTST